MATASPAALHGPSHPLRDPFQPAHPNVHLTLGDVGILKSTILPSFGLYSCLSVAAFATAEATDRVEMKDWLWPTAQVLNAWWSAIGRPMHDHGTSFTSAWVHLSWTEKLLLGGVTLWGTRLFARIASRSITRGKDDARYDGVKKEPGFWRTALFKVFLPEAVFLSVISLPFTVPFGLSGSAVPLEVGTLDAVRAFGVGLFSAGFALEAMSDAQLELHRQEREDLCRHGVWSIVRHPNYLGDTLVHTSFAVLNLANNFNPVVILGPLANYAFLRVVGGDKQTEESQQERYRANDPHKYDQLNEWRGQKNSFWPSLQDLVNPWALAVAGCGMIGIFVEEVARTRYVFE